MNKTIRLRRTIRAMQKPQMLMHFEDHDGHTRCHRCNETAKAYTYIPVLGDIYLCGKCRIKWDRWGLAIFKEMINYE